MSTDTRPAGPDDIVDLAGVLAAAFAEYPWTRWVVPWEGHEQRLRRLQEIYLRHALRVGLVLTTTDRTGVIALLPPTADPLPEQDLQEVVALHGDRVSALGAVTLPSAPEGAWTLATVGVSPTVQGRGTGTALVTAALAALPTPTPPVHLETSSDRNVALYRRCGFEVVARTTTAPDGPVVWSMTRPAAVTARPVVVAGHPTTPN